MPDLKSELQKLENLRFDDGDEDAPPTNIEALTMNMTHKTFHYYRLNPMSTVTECAEALGLPASRVAALALQLTGRKLLSRTKTGQEPYRYTAIATEMPNPVEVRKAALIKAHAARKANAQVRRQKKTKPAHKPEVSTKLVKPPSFNADEIVGGLSVVQARELFDKLRVIFGG